MINEIILFLQNLTPIQAFLTSIAAAIGVIILDIESGVSLNLPGRRRLGLAGIIIGSGTLYSFFLENGVQGVIVALRNELFSGLIIGALVAMLWVKQ